jgi:hypothetical protein
MDCARGSVAFKLVFVGVLKKAEEERFWVPRSLGALNILEYERNAVCELRVVCRECKHSRGKLSQCASHLLRGSILMRHYGKSLRCTHQQYIYFYFWFARRSASAMNVRDAEKLALLGTLDKEIHFTEKHKDKSWETTREKLVQQALNHKDYDSLRRISALPGGFGSNDVRRQAWYVNVNHSGRTDIHMT